MAGNEIRDRRQALLDEAIEADPDILRGQKLTRVLVVIWVVTRLFYVIVELYFARSGFIPFSYSNLLIFLLSLFLAVLLINGTKNLALLPLLGGAMTVINGFRFQYYDALKLDLYPEERLYLLSYLAASWAQVAIMLCLLLIPVCVKYAQAAGSINKSLMNRPEGPHL